MDQSRRELLKKGVVTGGLVWVAPAVTTMAPAAAQTCSPAVCTGAATGLFARTDFLSPPIQIFGTNGCVGPIDVGGLEAGQACGIVDAANCTVTASATAVDAGGLEVDFASSTATAPVAGGGCPATGTVTIVGLTVGGQPIVPSGAPNQVIEATAGGISTVLILNQQCCEGDEFVVRAINAVSEMPIIGTSQTIVAESRITSSCCPCTAPACEDPFLLLARLKARTTTTSSSTTTTTRPGATTTTQPGSTTTTRPATPTSTPPTTAPTTPTTTPATTRPTIGIPTLPTIPR